MKKEGIIIKPLRCLSRERLFTTASVFHIKKLILLKAHTGFERHVPLCHPQLQPALAQNLPFSVIPSPLLH